jgi:hypothetical protein
MPLACEPKPRHFDPAASVVVDDYTARSRAGTVLARRVSMTTKTIAAVSVAVMLALGALACTEGSLGNGNPNPATGGSTGGTSVGGTGVGGTGVGGTAGDPTIQLPGCVVDLLAQCAPQGPCTSATNDAGLVSDVCFASGVHASPTSVASSDTCGGISIMNVTKADGSPCYTFEAYADINMRCEGIVYTWKDASGAIVATGLDNPYSEPKLSINCWSTGEGRSCTRSLSGSPSCCYVTNFGSGWCTPPTGPGECVRGACSPTN